MTMSAQFAGPEPIQQVPLTSILTDAACQARVKIRPGVVRDYRRAMAEQISEGGLRFPPIVLFTDRQHYWLADGFHRAAAQSKTRRRSKCGAEVPAPGELRFAGAPSREHGAT